MGCFKQQQATIQPLKCMSSLPSPPLLANQPPTHPSRRGYAYQFKCGSAAPPTVGCQQAREGLQYYYI